MPLLADYTWTHLTIRSDVYGREYREDKDDEIETLRSIVLDSCGPNSSIANQSSRRMVLVPLA